VKLKTKISQLQRIAPKHTKYGQLYARRQELTGYYKKVDLWTLFVSDEGDHMLRRHVFESKKRRRDARGWHQWFSEHLGDIMRSAVLPGLARHTDLSKQWSVKQIMGWRANAVTKSKHPEIRSGRNKATKKRLANG
jgi:hypothetical protein